MNFPGNILGRISHLFEGDTDEILVFILVFLFVLTTGRRDENLSGDSRGIDGGLPVILIAIFIVMFLITDNNN